MSRGRDAVIAWHQAQQALVATRIEPWAHGTLVRAPDAPTYYDYNLVRLEGPDPGLSVAELAAAAEPLLDGLEHRRVEVVEEAAGERLRAGFEALGWIADRIAWLHRPAPAPKRELPAGMEAREEAFEASRPLRNAWRLESPWNDDDDFAAVEELAARRRGTRAVIGYGDGRPLGFAGYSRAGDTAEIELAFCLPEARGRGLGGALLARALREAVGAGASELIIAADDEGDSKRLYERLGFATVWVQHTFTRRPASARG